MKKVFIAIVLAVAFMVTPAMAEMPGLDYRYCCEMEQDQIQIQGMIQGPLNIDVPCLGTLDWDGMVLGQFTAMTQSNPFGGFQMQDACQALSFSGGGISIEMVQSSYQVQGHDCYFGPYVGVE